MPTSTPNYSLPRPIATDTFNLAFIQALIDAIDAHNHVNTYAAKGDVGTVSNLSTTAKTVVAAINELKTTLDASQIKTMTSDPTSPSVGQIWFRTDL